MSILEEARARKGPLLNRKLFQYAAQRHYEKMAENVGVLGRIVVPAKLWIFAVMNWQSWRWACVRGFRDVWRGGRSVSGCFVRNIKLIGLKIAMFNSSLLLIEKFDEF